MSGKLRLCSEYFVPKREYEQESYAEFALRRLGRAALSSLVDPLVARGCAGDPLQLEVKSTFPFLLDIERRNGRVIPKTRHIMKRLFLQSILSFRWGMGTLTARLEEELHKNLMLGITVDKLEFMPSGRISVSIDSFARVLEADAVVVATPAPEAGELLMSIDPEIITAMMGIPYVPLVAAYCAFNRADVRHDLNGIGFVIPRDEGMRPLGTIWSSSMFSGRCPEDEALLTCYLGGANDLNAIDASDDEIRNIVLSMLEEALGIQADPTFVHIKRWQQAIPQYNIGHRDRLDVIEDHIKGLPGVFLAGNYFSGISVEDTINSAKHSVGRVLKYLKVNK